MRGGKFSQDCNGPAGLPLSCRLLCYSKVRESGEFHRAEPLPYYGARPNAPRALGRSDQWGGRVQIWKRGIDFHGHINAIRIPKKKISLRALRGNPPLSG